MDIIHIKMPFKPRDYQKPIVDAILNKGYKRAILVLPRRSGKDIVAWNILIELALKEVGMYYYCLPTYGQCRKVLWDGITNDGFRFLDFIPKELIANINQSEMKIRFVNGSIISMCGSDAYQNLIGSNPRAIVYSEYALSDPMSYKYLRPILTGNAGIAIFISTPRGRNHLYELFQLALKDTKNWFVQKMTVEETKHIPIELIKQELESGEMSEDLVQQEYYCSWNKGVEGSFFCKYVDKMRLNGQIGTVLWDSSKKVHISCDLGMRDKFVILFFQLSGNAVHIIDYYDDFGKSLEFYARKLDEYPYKFGRRFAPHDVKVRELGTGLSRLERASQLGLHFDIAPNLPIDDGIESVRALTSRLFIDETRCKPLIKAMESYRQEYNPRLNVYSGRPLHDEHSHACDALRYLALSIPMITDNLSKESLNKMYKESLYEDEYNSGSVFDGERNRY